MKFPSNPPGIIDSSGPPVSWPSEGRIQLKNLKIRYLPNAPLVLKGINYMFKGGKRVGVIERTSSGKTTLIYALFRLIEPAGGKIMIDDLDICNIGLSDLRSKISIIPQRAHQYSSMNASGISFKCFSHSRSITLLNRDMAHFLV